MKFQLSYFKSWKMMLWKCCTQYASKFGKLSSGHRTGKVSFHSNPKESQAKECSNYHTIAHISPASKVMLKILQARLQQYVNRELPDVQAGFRQGRGTRDQIANIHWIMEKVRVPEKYLFLFYWLCESLWLCGSQYTVEILQDMGILDHLMCSSWETYIQVRKQQLELDMEQQTGSI